MKKDIQSRVSTRIRRILQKKGMSAEKLAFSIDMSKAYMYDFLNGKKDTSLKTLQRIAEGLNVEVEDFFHD